MTRKHSKKSTAPAPRKGKLSNMILSCDYDGVQQYLAKQPRTTVMRRNKDGRNAMYDAIFSHEEKIFLELLEYGFDPTDIDRLTGATALHLAAAEGKFDLVQHLVSTTDIDINATDKEGKSPLFYALIALTGAPEEEFYIDKDNLKTALYLITHGARFSPIMHTMRTSMEVFMHVLISRIQIACYGEDAHVWPAGRMYLKFIMDALNEYNSAMFHNSTKSL